MAVHTSDGRQAEESIKNCMLIQQDNVMNLDVNLIDKPYTEAAQQNSDANSVGLDAPDVLGGELTASQNQYDDSVFEHSVMTQSAIRTQDEENRVLTPSNLQKILNTGAKKQMNGAASF